MEINELTSLKQFMIQIFLKALSKFERRFFVMTLYYFITYPSKLKKPVGIIEIIEDY